ncbi:MAG: hypothetical protein ACREJM_06365, partial [Candidatus Saccharimonadales bacterium]
MRHITGVLAIMCAALVGASVPAAGQGIFSKLGSKVKERVDAKSNAAMDSVLNKAASAVVCAITDKACLSNAKASGKPIKVTDASGKPVSSADSAAAISAAVASAAQAAEPALDSAGSTGTASAASPASNTVLVNYDFVPGDRVIYAEDFTNDNVGDFPKRLELKNGNLEVAEWNGGRFLRSTSSAQVMVPLPEVLPNRFTFEMDFNGSHGWSGALEFVDPDSEPKSVSKVSFSPVSGGVHGPVNSEADLSDSAVRPVTHVAVMADDLYVKVYLNGVRVANAPKATLG